MPLATDARGRRPCGGRVADRDRGAGDHRVLAPIAWFWQQSLVPGDLSPMEMGYADYGGGPATTHAPPRAGRQHARPGPSGPRRRHGGARGAQGEVRHPRPRVDGRLHAEPHLAGPEIVAKQGDLIQVTLHNESVPDGITLHWHGVDVPAAEDGVAGVTQDAVRAGQSHVYRFVAKDAGTYWYHSHQVSHEQVKKRPVRRTDRATRTRRPTWSPPSTPTTRSHGQRRVRRTAGGGAPGPTVRVRLINTDNGPMAPGSTERRTRWSRWTGPT